MSLYSDCCSAPPVGGMEEYGICGACKEHCEFWDDEENECNNCGEIESHCECLKQTHKEAKK